MYKSSEQARQILEALRDRLTAGQEIHADLQKKVDHAVMFAHVPISDHLFGSISIPFGRPGDKFLGDNTVVGLCECINARHINMTEDKIHDVKVGLYIVRPG